MFCSVYLLVSPVREVCVNLVAYNPEVFQNLKTGFLGILPQYEQKENRCIGSPHYCQCWWWYRQR